MDIFQEQNIHPIVIQAGHQPTVEQMRTMMKLNAIELDDIFATFVLFVRKCTRNLDHALHPAKIFDCDNIKENLQNFWS